MTATATSDVVADLRARLDAAEAERDAWRAVADQVIGQLIDAGYPPMDIVRRASDLIAAAPREDA